jgi:hypothetical protein
LKTLNILREKQQIVQQQWFQQVDSVLKNTPIIQSGVENVNSVIQKLQEQYTQLYAAGKSFDREEFIQQVRQRIGHTWSDQLRPLVASYYDRASEAVSNVKDRSPVSTEKILVQVRQTLGPEWENKLRDTISYTLTSANTVYTAALHQYIQLLNTANGQRASLNQFLDRVKQQLGSVYSDRLEPSLSEFYERASKYTLPDLQQIYRQIDADQNGEISLADVINTTRAAVQAINAQVSNVKTSVLKTSYNVADYVIPPVSSPSEGKENQSASASGSAENYSVLGLAGHVTQRVKDHVTTRVTAVNTAVTEQASKRYEQAKDISSNTVAPRVGVDPIAVAENIYNKITGKVVQTQQSVEQTAHATVQEVKHSLEVLQQRLEDIAKHAASRTGVDQINGRVQAGVTDATGVVKSKASEYGVTPRIHELQVKVKQALDALSTLSHEAGDFVLHRQLTRLPADVFYFLTHAPALLLKFIFASASLQQSTAASKDKDSAHQKSDEELELLLQKVEEVLVALKNLFLLTPVQKQEIKNDASKVAQQGAQAAQNAVSQAQQKANQVKEQAQKHYNVVTQQPFISSTRAALATSPQPKQPVPQTQPTPVPVPAAAPTPASSSTTTTTSTTSATPSLPTPAPATTTSSSADKPTVPVSQVEFDGVQGSQSGSKKKKQGKNKH